MRDRHEHLLFVGTNGCVRAVDKRTGEDVWDVSLPGTGYDIVSLLYEPGVLFAGSKGHLFALNPETGAFLWKNGLKGLGDEHMVLASGGAITDPVLLRVKQEDEEKQQEETEDAVERVFKRE